MTLKRDFRLEDIGYKTPLLYKFIDKVIDWIRKIAKILVIIR